MKRPQLLQLPRTTILSRSVESNSLEGMSKKGKVLLHLSSKSKKAYLYQANKGKSEEQILNTFNDEHPGHNNPKMPARLV